VHIRNDGDRGAPRQNPEAEREPGVRISFSSDEFFSALGGLVVANWDDFHHQVEEAAARVEWCEKKLSFERKTLPCAKGLGRE
jgi:hypothetical protein